MGFAGIFSKPSAMKQFQLALEEIDLDLLKRFPSIEYFFKEHIKSEAFKPEGNKAIARLIKGGTDPKVTTYLFIRVLLEDFLLDGRYHVVKGKLTRDGECYFALYNNVVRELRSLGWFAAGEAKAHFEEIKAGVAATAPAEQSYRSSA